MKKQWFDVQLTLRIKAKSVDDALDVGIGAAEHVMDTFNDDKSIDTRAHVVVLPPAPAQP